MKPKRTSRTSKGSLLKKAPSPFFLILILSLWGGFQIYQEYAFPVVVQENQNIEMRACFVPNHNCQERLIKEIEQAKKEILLMCYNFNDEKIADALIQAKERGVSVAIVADKTQKNHVHSQIPRLRKAHIPVYSDDKVAIAHNKVAILDESLTITGSFNLTASAQRRNAENLLFISSQELAKQYKTYWQSRRDVSQKLSPT